MQAEITDYVWTIGELVALRYALFVFLCGFSLFPIVLH